MILIWRLRILLHLNQGLHNFGSCFCIRSYSLLLICFLNHLNFKKLLLFVFLLFPYATLWQFGSLGIIGFQFYLLKVVLLHAYVLTLEIVWFLLLWNRLLHHRWSLIRSLLGKDHYLESHYCYFCYYFACWGLKKIHFTVQAFQTVADFSHVNCLSLITLFHPLCLLMNRQEYQVPDHTSWTHRQLSDYLLALIPMNHYTNFFAWTFAQRNILPAHQLNYYIPKT